MRHCSPFSPVITLAGAAILLLAACTADDPVADATTAAPSSTEESTTSTVVTSPPTTERGVIYEPDCDDEVECAFSFVLDSTTYEVDCHAIREDKVTNDVLGRGQLNSVAVTANVIDGVNPKQIVALRYPGGECESGDEPTSDWSAAFVNENSDEVAELLCEVGLLTDAQRAAEGCPDPVFDEAAQLDDEVIAEATDLMSTFLDAIFSGDPAARDFWSGYPEPDAEADNTFEQFLVDFEWVRAADDIGFKVVPSAGFTPSPVVVVTDYDENVAAFVLSAGTSDQPALIQRLPQFGTDLVIPTAGSVVMPGDTVAILGIPVEGGARAYFDYLATAEIEEVIVDHVSGTTSVVLPDELPEVIVLTFSLASPELPTAFTVIYLRG